MIGRVPVLDVQLAVDSSIAYAENPPKKYQDIYPVNFDTDPDGLYAETLRIVRHWMDHGVQIFRLDNPHTTSPPFWDWLLDTVLVVVNLDPHRLREATVWLDTGAPSLEPGGEFTVTDELTGESYRWERAGYVRLDPAWSPAHIFAFTPDWP